MDINRPLVFAVWIALTLFYAGLDVAAWEHLSVVGGILMTSLLFAAWAISTSALVGLRLRA